MFKLMLMLMEMEEEQKHMTEEEKECNTLVLPVKTASLSIFNCGKIKDYAPVWYNKSKSSKQGLIYAQTTQ